MLNFNVAIVDCSYLFQLLQSNHHQAVYQNGKREVTPSLHLMICINFTVLVFQGNCSISIHTLQLDFYLFCAFPHIVSLCDTNMQLRPFCLFVEITLTEHYWIKFLYSEYH